MILSHISIKDFAIIKDLSLDLHEGFNVLTGETGAGKSIIIEAVSMALGARADTDYIRKGCSRSLITLIFSGISKEIKEYLLKEGIIQEGDESTLILQRELNSSGKNLCRINGFISPLSVLSELAKGIADIHGQYDNQRLLISENHLHALDACREDELRTQKEDVRKAFTTYVKAAGKLKTVKAEAEEAGRRRDFIKYELEDIKAVSPKPGEDAALEEEIRLMENREKIFSHLGTAYELLEGGSASSLELLGRAARELEVIAGYSQNLEECRKVVEDAYYSIEDIVPAISSVLEGLEYSKSNLDEAIGRADMLDRLKKKYGGSLESVLEHEKELKEKLRLLEDSPSEIRELAEKAYRAKAAYLDAARELTNARTGIAKEFSEEITAELADLNFKDAVFKVDISAAPPSDAGMDKAEFLISTNKGEDCKPLSKIASGGELSRIMLAIKTVIGASDRVPTLIFDEIDSGISGATAGIVGEKLQEIAQNHQVICITHLPQIAAMGRHHYRIEKISDNISTSATVTPLGEEERITELAKLLSGKKLSDEAIENAKELLRQA